MAALTVVMDTSYFIFAVDWETHRTAKKFRLKKCSILNK